MIKKIALFVFFELTKTPSIWVLHGIDHVIGFGEINLVLISDNLTLGLSFQRHFDDVPRLVIEKPMGVSQPGNCTEKYSWILRHDLLGNFLTLGLLRRSIGMVRVHVVGVFSS